MARTTLKAVLLTALAVFAHADLAHARRYSGGEARFISRDPAGYRENRWGNLYEYVYGNPSIGTDPMGLGIGIATCHGRTDPNTDSRLRPLWESGGNGNSYTNYGGSRSGPQCSKPAGPCCGKDRTPYDKKTQCCCNGKVFQKAPVDTGAKYCENAISPVMGHSSPDHAWVEFNGHTYEFNPVGNILHGRGEVTRDSLDSKYTDGWSYITKECDIIKLSPCKYDIDKFKKTLGEALEFQVSESNAGRAPYYSFIGGLLGYNCQTWASGMIAAAKSAARRKVPCK